MSESIETGSNFSDLDWRLDVQVASRNYRSLVNPTFILNLETEINGEKSNQLLQTDYTNLKHLCSGIFSYVRFESWEEWLILKNTFNLVRLVRFWWKQVKNTLDSFLFEKLNRLTEPCFKLFEENNREISVDPLENKKNRK